MSAYQRMMSGLLGSAADPDEEKRLSEEQRRQAMMQGVSAMGATLLAGSGPSPYPVGFGQIAGQALLAGRESYAGATQQQIEAMQRKAQREAEERFIATLDPTQQRLARAFGVGPYAKEYMQQQGGLRKVEREAELREPKRSSYAQQALDILGAEAEGTPEFRALVHRLATQPKGSTVNVNAGDNAGTFGKKGQELSATTYFDMQSQASGAMQGLQAIDALESIFETRDTGKIPQASAMLGQWLGTEAGADFQASEAIVQDRVTEILNAMSGPQTDKDAERAIAQIPNMGTDPRARRMVFDYIRRRARGKVSNYQAATEYANKHGSLVGFMAPNASDFSLRQPATRAESASGGNSLDDMDIEELEAMAERMRRGQR